MSDAILKRLREAARDIERLQDLLRKDGEDHARIVRDLTDRHERRITKYAEAIAKAKAEARRQTLEEAARIAEGWEVEAAGHTYMTSGNGQFWDPGTVYDQGRVDVAGEIRAMIGEAG